MTGAPPAFDRARLDALMYRMLGGLLLLGAGSLLVLTLLLLQLPHASIDGVAVLVLPGTGGRHGLSPLAAPMLGGGASVLGLGGVAALALGRRRAPFGMPSRGVPRSFRRSALVLLAGVALLVAVLLRR